MAEKKQGPVFNRAGTHVYLYNPETRGLWECGPEAAEVFVEKLGWEYVEAPEEDTSELFPDVKPKEAKKAASKTSGD
jgi:hypothetical protein